MERIFKTPSKMRASSSLLQQRTLALEQGRMRVVKAAVKRVRGEVAEVFFVKFAQSLDEGGRLVHDPCGKGVSLIFVSARPPVQKGRKPKRNHSRQQPEQED